MTAHTAKNRILFIIYLFFLLTSIVTAFISMSSADNHNQENRDYIDLSSGWTCAKDGSAAVLKNISGTYEICRELPNMENDRVLFLNLKSLNLKAYVDGVCIYSSPKAEERFFGKTSGSFFAEIPIFAEYSGKTVTLCAENPYNDGSGKITMIYLGKSSDILKAQTGSILTGFIISVMITFLGLLFIVMFIPMWRHKTVGAELLYFGLFALNSGIFMLTDCKFLQLIFPDAHFYHMLAESHMMLFIIPLFLFLNKMYESCNDLMVYCTCIFSIFNFIACYLLNITEVMDYHETVWITHTSYGISIVFLLIVIAKELYRNGRKNMYHNAGIFIICISAVLDIVMLKIGTSFETTLFTRMGVLIYVCLEGIQIFIGFFTRYREAMKAKLLSRLAYHDGLTDLLNRTSYMEELEALRSSGELDNIIAMFDVNNLKTVNDTYGHTAGDEMIIAVAEEMKKCFGGLGKCFRIGGDEFVFISDPHCEGHRFREVCDEFTCQLSQADKNGLFMMPITIAVGSCTAKGSSSGLDSIINEADARMYENKRRMKMGEAR